MHSKGFLDGALCEGGEGVFLARKCIVRLVGVILRRMQHLESYQIERVRLPLHGQMKIKSQNTQQPLRWGEAF